MITQRNVANVIRDAIRQICPPLAYGQLEGVWVTGSTVWQHLYHVDNFYNDIDIICESATSEASVIKHLNLIYLRPCNPGYNQKLPPGSKYLDPLGRTVDVWVNPNISSAIQMYPNISHGYCKAAWCPATGELRMRANTNVEF